MDRNTLTGLVLIGLLLVGFMWFSQPSKQQEARQKAYQDSMLVVQKKQAEVAKLRAEQEAAAQAKIAEESVQQMAADSTKLFHTALVGEAQKVVLKNAKTAITLSTLGGVPVSVTFADYLESPKENQDGKKVPVTLMNPGDTQFSFEFAPREGAILRSEELYFEPVQQTDSTVTMRLVADAHSYIDFMYTLHADDYLLDMKVKAVNMSDKLLPSKTMHVTWNSKMRQIELDRKYSQRYTKCLYKLQDGGTESLQSAKGTKVESPEEMVNWVGYKNRFFTMSLISDSYFSGLKVSSTVVPDETSHYLQDFKSAMEASFDPTGHEMTSMHIYYGPVRYRTLKTYDKGRNDKWYLTDLVDLGLPIIRQVNEYFILPLFDFLSGLGLHMGLIIFIMTVIVKIVIMPTTWKTFISQTKTRVLKPKIEEINQKYPNEADAMKKQQETMQLYSQYGASPMAGCLPMVIQMPILFAMFMFVPTAIAFRGQSFLWAADLSNYDTGISLPFNIPFLGDHLSIFCLLMTVTTLLNQHFTMQQQDNGSNNQMASMKWMMYLMPVMFLFILNGYPAGLNYYYFISTLASVLIMLVMKRVVDEKAVLAKMEAYKEKNKGKKKSGFAARVEAMQKQQEAMQQQKNRK